MSIRTFRPWAFFLTLLFLGPSYVCQGQVALGTITPISGRLQDDREGSVDYFQVNPGFSFHYKFPFLGTHYFHPELGFYFHTGLEDEYSKKTYQALGIFGYSFTDKWALRYGPGVMMTKISGDGEEIILNNGTGTSTFYAPSEDITSYNITFHLGTEFTIFPRHAIRADMIMSQAFSSKQRSIGHLISYFFYY